MQRRDALRGSRRGKTLRVAAACAQRRCVPHTAMARPLRWFALALVAVLATSACSRLTFIRPSMGSGKYEKTSPDYNMRDDAATQKRVRVGELLGLAQSKLLANDLAGAQSRADAALKLDPGSADAHTLLGVISDRRGDTARAGAHYARAVALAPARGVMLNNYGAWLCSNGRAAESLPQFERAIADPSYAEAASAQSNLGACALKAGDLARVEQPLRAALAVQPDNTVALDAMADYQFRSGQFLDARAFSQRRLAAAPATAEALQLAARIEDRLGDRTAAARYSQRLQTEFPQAGTPSNGDARQP